MQHIVIPNESQVSAFHFSLRDLPRKGGAGQSLGLKGPSMAVDTACSSSLAALHAAVWSLESNRTGGMGGLVQAAIVAAADVMLGAGSLMIRSVAGMLSPDGRCKTFNATADGYIRGEGAGAVLLRQTTVGKTSRPAPNGPQRLHLVRANLSEGVLNNYSPLSSKLLSRLVITFMDVSGTGLAWSSALWPPIRTARAPR